MEELKEIIKKYATKNLVYMTISNPRYTIPLKKVKVRPILLKETLMFQLTETVEQKELHKNYCEEEIEGIILSYLQYNFKQIEIKSITEKITILISKKGKITIKSKKERLVQEQKLTHNRKKQYILQEGIAIEFLQDLGVMTKEGKVINAKYDKFKQINRFLEFIEDILPSLSKERELTIIDFGCGKSYLTFAMYYYLKEIKQYNIRIIGLDLKKDVIEHCNRLSEKYGYDKLKFYQGDIKSYEGVTSVDMVVTLHACDTATDYALAKAVKWGASVILSVPCCQHELNRQIYSQELKAILKYGLIKERFAALVTDALRAELLEQQGYEVQILEFIDMEHTPKNILIRAVKKNKIKIQNEKQDYETCKCLLQVQPTLENLLKKSVY